MVQEHHRTLGPFPFVVGGLSYIPVAGVLFGAVAVLWGTATRKAGGKDLAAVGAGGIAFTAVCCAFFLYLSAAQVKEAEAPLARQTITSLMYAIEFHKTQTGMYPEDLHTLSASLPEYQRAILFDPMKRQTENGVRAFHYELINESHYVLLGVGTDDEPHTGDDIVPDVKLQHGGGVGLMIEMNDDVADRRER